MNKKTQSMMISAIIIIILALISFLPSLFQKSKEGIVPNHAMQVHFIDVGQGDSIYIKLPNGENMLIDAGENEQGNAVCKYLRSQNVETLHYVIGTHPHSDHIGGLDTVMENYNVKNLYLPNVSHTSKTFLEVVDIAKEKQIPTHKAQKGVTLVESEDLNITILSPVSEYYEELNDYSVVVSLTYKDVSFLFTGDAETPVEKELLPNLTHYDVLKVGHHGSTTSSSEAFLKAVSPEFAVISVGKGNKYDHPHEEIITRLERQNAKIYCTDEKGTVIAASDGEKIEMITER